jgi:tetratricopeptide (TPR) repeat protein
LAKLNEALKIYPQFADGYYERGSLYAYRRQHALAIADFEKAIMYSPSAPGAYNNIARIYYMQGDKAKSFEMLDYSLSRNSQRNYNAFLLRGILFLEIGKKREGEADIDFAERIQKGVKQQSASAIAEAQRSRPQWALKYAELDKKTSNDAALFELKEEDRKAVYILDRVLAKDPNNAEAYLMRAKALYNLKQFVVAQDDVSQALRLKPDLGEAHRMMGRCLEVWGKGDEAINQFERAIKLEPQSAMAYVDRAAATFQFHPNLQGTALQYLDAALKADPRNPYAWYNRAPYYAPNLSDPEPNWDFMIYHYSKAIEYKPDFAGAYGSRGVAYLGKYLRTKDPALQAQGQKDIKTALRLKPELKATLEAMVDDLQNIPASKAYLKRMIAALFDPTPPTHSSSSSSSGGSGGACSGLGYGAASACNAGDYYATERYKSGTATGGDRRKYGDY